jgi:hypothetical protein
VIGSGVDERDATGAVAALHAGLDRFAALDWSSLSTAELVDAVQQWEAHQRRSAAVSHALVAELDARGVAGEYARRSTTDLLVELLRIDAREAAGRVRAALELGPRRTVTGQVLPALFAQVAAAQADGELSPAHARIITTTISELPADVLTALDADPDSDIEGFLVAQARQFDPRTLRLVARRLTDTLNPDGRGYTDADRSRLRAVTLRQHPDGTCSGSYRTDAVTGEALRTFFDAAAQPVKDNSGEPDPRTPDQRRHDALRDWLLATLRTGELPATGGVTTTIVLTMTPDQLRRDPGSDPLVPTGHDALITVDDALTLLGDAQVFPVLHGSMKKIAAYGDTHRIFTQSQRLAMASRDRGCSFPGCTVGPSWCEAHHITEFSISRRTTVADGTLLCSFHHRHFEQRGWRCTMIDGLPHWTPPRWIDPNQAPHRNQAHQPEVCARLPISGRSASTTTRS